MSSLTLSAPLQQAIYSVLTNDARIPQELRDNVYDQLLPPEEAALPSLFAILGEENCKDAGSVTHRGGWHELRFLVCSSEPGFAALKAAAGAVAEVLLTAALPLPSGKVCHRRFGKSQASYDAQLQLRSVGLVIAFLVNE